MTAPEVKLAAQSPQMLFDREVYFDRVRESLFYGSLNQGQVDGQEAILGVWEKYRAGYDLRWLAYMLATTIHETASTMLPIEEYGKGSGQPYGATDPETNQKYYGRGFVQLTWRDNYARADREIEEQFNQDAGCEWNAANALIPKTAAAVMFLGMEEGWFRGDDDGRQTLQRYFNEDVDDPVNARDIINGDISKNGGMIAGYHEKFLEALIGSELEDVDPVEPSVPVAFETVDIAIISSPGAVVSVSLNGHLILAGKG